MSTKEIITRLDRLIEIGEGMQSSKVTAIEAELKELHDWHTTSAAKTENISNTMTWFWRLAPMMGAIVFMAAEFKHLTK